MTTRTSTDLATQVRDGTVRWTDSRPPATVPAIQRDLGIPAVRPPTYPVPYPSVEAAFRARTRPVAGGHLEWTGPRQANGTPVFRHRGKMYTASRIAFRLRTGREPQGYAQPECDMDHCVEPAHIEDTPGRTRLREQLRYLGGGRSRPSQCRSGHDQTLHGRLYADGRAYCAICRQRPNDQP